MKTFEKYFIFSIIFLSSILRLWRLGEIPPHLTPDEAALGYNAYSILRTGKDEYGQFFPIVFKSFGDYKPGLYIYLTLPFIAFFGLNEFAVRLPSAIAGIFAVYLVYLITLNAWWFKNAKDIINENEFRSKRFLGFFASFLLAVSPWHIHFSRGAWEANVSLTLTLAGIYFFLKALENSKMFFPSLIFFSLTLLTYQGAKLSTLIVIVILFIVFARNFWKNCKDKVLPLTLSVVVASIIALPIVFSVAKGEAGRLKIFSIFSYPRKEEEISELLLQANETPGSLTYYLFHSETLNYARMIIGRWFNHFSGRFLFFEGDYQNPRHSAPNHGMLLLADLILIPFGLLALIKSRSKFSSFSLLWLVLSCLPSSLTRDQVNAVRALNMVVPLIFVSASGINYLLQIELLEKSYLKKKLPGFRLRLTPLFLFGILFLSLIYYLDSYFVHLTKHNSKYWEYGYKQIVEAVSPIQKNYKEIKVQQSFSQPYIYFLFYQKYDPLKYQSQAKLVESEYKGDVGYVERLDNICFCAIDWPRDKKEHGTLVIADSIRIPDSELVSDSLSLSKEIKYLDGSVAFRIVEVK